MKRSLEGTVCIMDTSVFCNILKVPNRCQQHEMIKKEFQDFIGKNYSFLLPLAVIYETGNHIAQQGDGRKRRQVADRFIKAVKAGFKGDAPWTPTPLHQADEILEWIDEFRDAAMQGTGVGDLSIIQIFHKQCKLHKHRRIFIWSLDKHLSGYDTGS